MYCKPPQVADEVVEERDDNLDSSSDAVAAQVRPLGIQIDGE